MKFNGTPIPRAFKASHRDSGYCMPGIWQTQQLAREAAIQKLEKDPKRSLAVIRKAMKAVAKRGKEAMT